MQLSVQGHLYGYGLRLAFSELKVLMEALSLTPIRLMIRQCVRQLEMRQIMFDIAYTVIPALLQYFHLFLFLS